MRPVKNRWLRALLLSSVYLLGALGILASTGGGGDGDPRIELSSVQGGFNPFLVPPFFVSPSGTTYFDELSFYGWVLFNNPDDEEFFDKTVNVTWRNNTTGQSGSEQLNVRYECWLFNAAYICDYGYPPPPIFIPTNEFSFDVQFDYGMNEIAITATSEGTTKTFSTTVERLQPIPLLETRSATDILSFETTLNGIVTITGETSDAWFEYSTDPTLLAPNTTPVRTIAATVYFPIDYSHSEQIDNLIGDTTYYYRLAATNLYGDVYGDIESFTTKPAVSIITSPAVQLFPRNATVSGSANPNGEDAETWFQLGFDPEFANYVTTSPITPIGSGDIFVSVDHLFDQLSSGSKYYYRLNGSNPWSTVRGDTLSFTTPFAGYTCWSKTYRPYVGAVDQESTSLLSIEETSDNGFISVLYNWTDFPRNLVMKSNQEGGLEWIKTFHDQELSDPITYPYFRNASVGMVKEIGSGNYISAGTIQHVHALNRSGWNFLVAELNENGEINWQRSYGFDRDIISNVDIEVVTDGYILAGSRTVPGLPQNHDIQIVKLNQSGNILWQYLYSGDGHDYVFDIEVVDDGYIIAGTTASFGAGGDDIWILKLDQDGAIVWQQTFGDINNEEVTAVAVSSTLISVAGLIDIDGIGRKPWVLNLFSNGSVNWQNTYGDFWPSKSIQLTNDDGYILGVAPNKVLKLNNNGIIEWQKEFTFGVVDLDHDTVREVSGGGYIVAGISTLPGSYGPPSQIKTDTDGGCPPLDSDTSIIPSATNIIGIPSTSAQMPSNLLTYNSDSFAVSISAAVEHVAP